MDLVAQVQVVVILHLLQILQQLLLAQHQAL